MPELPEGLAHYLATKVTLESLRVACACLRIFAIYADLTKKEAERLRKPLGMIQKLTPDTRFCRGQSGNQTPLLAEVLQGRRSNPPPIAITELEIKGVHHSVRALIVNLGPVWLRLAYLTHTAVQVYRKDRWEELLLVPSMKRKFSIGLAFECEDFVLAFTTMDKLFQPIWATTRAGLALAMGEVEPPYVLDEYHRFLQGVAQWVDSRWHLDRFDFAVNSIREANQVFVGIGAYSINEVMFSAGTFFVPLWYRPNASSSTDLTVMSGK